MNNLADTYKSVESDPIRWLDTARGFMMSGRLIWKQLAPFFEGDSPKENQHEEMLAYSQSFLLLTGFAFENLYRGILTASGSPWQKALEIKGGHGLSEHLSSVATPKLSADEQYLAERLETYLQVGRPLSCPEKTWELHQCS